MKFRNKKSYIYLISAIILLLFIMTSLVVFPFMKGITTRGLVLMSSCLFILLVISIILIILGKKELNKSNIKDTNIEYIRSEAKIISFRETKDDTYESIYYMIIEYIGESGKTHMSVVPIEHQNYVSSKVGNKIECFIKGEECYINSFNILK